jgi:hypothetical protein
MMKYLLKRWERWRTKGIIVQDVLSSQTSELRGRMITVSLCLLSSSFDAEISCA